jgi:hypothetical protein
VWKGLVRLALRHYLHPLLDLSRRSVGSSLRLSCPHLSSPIRHHHAPYPAASCCCCTFDPFRPIFSVTSPAVTLSLRFVWHRPRPLCSAAGQASQIPSQATSDRRGGIASASAHEYSRSWTDQIAREFLAVGRSNDVVSRVLGQILLGSF